MSNQKRDYDSTVARIAGNIAAGLVATDEHSGPYNWQTDELGVAKRAVSLARAIVAEVKSTEPNAEGVA